MAQKKITDLQLISALVDSANYVVDTGVQTYRSTATQMMTYIYSKLNALSTVDPLAADFVLGLDASDSNNPKRFAVSRFKNATYRAVTTTDSVGADDDTMVLSGASFTSTLPTAVGVAGKRYKFLHAGTSLSQVYTLATTSSQTIGGVAGGSYALYTVGECLEIESDGANWIIVNHFASTDWVDAGALTIGAVTTPPTKATGIANDKIYWKRVSKNCDIRFVYKQSNTTSAAAGSGDYLISVPSNISLDTNSVVVYGGASIGGGAASPTNVVGSGFCSNSTANVATNLTMFDSSRFRMNIVSSSDGGMVGSVLRKLDDAGIIYSGILSIPVSGWQP